GSSFERLYRAWTLDLARNEFEPQAPARELLSDRLAQTRIRSQQPGSEQAGPRATHLGTGRVDRWTALGTTSHFAIVDGSTSGAIEIDVTGPPEANLQVTAVPLGDDHPRLELSAVRVRCTDGQYALRATIKESNGVPTLLSLISWEPVAPGMNSLA